MCLSVCLSVHLSLSIQAIDKRLALFSMLTPEQQLERERDEALAKLRSMYFTMFLLLTYIVLPVSIYVIPSYNIMHSDEAIIILNK